jgi:tyrosinase
VHDETLVQLRPVEVTGSGGGTGLKKPGDRLPGNVFVNGLFLFHRWLERPRSIRMCYIMQYIGSCFVRAFLNDHGADASTPIHENPHYAGYLAIFGHGECYGGPGHCELPPPRARRFDQRLRSHNTPRNHRLDITAAAHRMLQTGDELQITLLVIGVDYREERDLLRLEGVSLNLLD